MRIRLARDVKNKFIDLLVKGGLSGGLVLLRESETG